METIFQTEKNKFIKPIFFIWTVLMVTFFIAGIISSKADDSLTNVFLLGPVTLLIIGFAFSLWKNNYYKIIDNELIVVLGWLFKVKISVQDIDSIKLNQKITSQLDYFGQTRATLSLKGIVIYYKKKKSIYISPAPQDKFINILTELNKNIIIKDGLPK